MAPTARYELIQLRLGRDLAQYVTARRAKEKASWRRIASDLSTITGMPVSYESLRTWLAADAGERAA